MAPRSSSPRVTTSLAFFAAILSLVSTGCTTWPFRAKERTSIITPGMRVAAVREMGAQADDIDAAEQARLSEQLANQIRTEPDPLVRRAIQETVAEYSTPLAQQMLLAGLNDDDLDVRLACCLKLGERADPSTVAQLQEVLKNDEELDVRLAAVDALGKIRSSESVAALGIAVNDRDPAMQYAAVQSLQAVSGLELGNDVQVWREYAAGKQPQISPQLSVAERIKKYSPF
ncbi:MAG: HEAT repeat domain-containing protein [Planctomycetales bacterium]|nr:HEAT repeat domain-containing protein [Planctomycetales bacterium]